ncbi:conjugal transfer protein TraH [Shewanella sp. GD03713]|uniref:conjugal transfer protein TraH n=1 Tax=Shewanella TaxID=22 RepID=UPI0024499D5A|nr:conjugal transfer protein TraH [Shewanella sp. GD03713]MDH1472654.1 conjugal transfer protein TraH [Shewanella sp. GD03713]
MSFIKRKAKLVTLASTVVLSLAVPSTAVGSDPLKNVFGMMTTSTGGAVFESQKRNGVAFGTFSARFSMYQPKVVSFTPPSLSAGCGGIDFFGGSISLIKKEELVQMGRNIAAGAAVYAFNLAVESICPSCAEGMAWLQDKLDQFNELVSADCQDVVTSLSENRVGAGAADKLMGIANKNGWQEGLTTYADVMPDTHGSWIEMLSARSSTGDAKDAPVDGMLGNQIWDALGEAKVDRWNFAAGWDKQQVQELLMSITGTMIVGPSSNGTDVEWQPVPKTLDIEDLVYSDAGTKIKVLQCDTNEPKKDNRLPCTKIKDMEGTEVSWEGMHHQVMRLLMGDGTRTGIARKITYKGNIAVDEQALINNASVPFMSMLFYLGNDVEAQRAIASLVASQMSFQMIDEMIEHMYKMLKNAELSEQGNTKTTAERIQFIKGRIVEIEQQRAALKKKHDAQVKQANEIFETYNALIEGVKNMSALGV